MGGRRARHGCVAGLVGILLFMGATAVPALAVPVAGSLRATPAGPVVAGEKIELAGALPPAKARSVQLQSRLGAAAWHTVATARSKATGRFTFTATVAGPAGATLSYRVYAPAARIGGKRFPARRTPVVSCRVVQATGTLTAQPLVVEGGGYQATAQFAPARAGRPVTIRGWNGIEWLPLGSGSQDASGRVVVDVTALSQGEWRLTARAARWHGAAPVSTQEYGVHVQPRLDLGSLHSCQVGTDGKAWCWGWNIFGQLGDHTTDLRSRPVQVAGGEWVRLSGGVYSTCGLKWDGSAWCWGSNFYGQLGDGTGANSLDPVQVPGEWVGLDVGDRHACGVRSDGTAWCWGDNASGQLGDDSTEQRLAPVQVGTVSDWVLVDAGYAHTCGLRADGSAWCWGSNGSGRLGDGTTQERHVPVQVGTASDWVDISVGESVTCGVRAGGTAWCWGANNNGLLGTGSGDDASSPVQVGTATDWLRVATGTYQTCGVRADASAWWGSAWCWGLNADGQLGTGVPGNSDVPVQVAGGTGSWTHRIVTGSGHVCAFAEDTSTWCWGANTYGQVGDGTAGSDQHRSTPTLVTWP
jgi:alpha-tubulin suppressor-like RCC1 family protein